MPLIQSTYRPNHLVRNGHLQTIYPFLFRKVKDVQFERVRIETRDKDFLDIDITKASSNKVVILSHGLEGSTDKGYIRGMTKLLNEVGNYNIIAWNMRSCSGVLNHSKYFYHGASINDLDDVVEFAKKEKNFKEINFVSFSLGSNLASYYLSKLNYAVHPEIKSAVFFSSPLNLGECIDKLGSTKMGRLYTEIFLSTMRKKIIAKSKKMGDLGLDLEAILKVRSFRQFDEICTAPLHGFLSAEDYYQKASARKLIHKIEIPVLYVQAKDDPFLTPDSFPIELAENSSLFHLEITESGGHIGFWEFSPSVKYWSENRALDFINSFTD